MPVNDELRAILEKQQYRVVGGHSGVKLCHWLGQKMLHGRACYKEQFYGIRSHRCLQMTPALNNCTQSCLFCWRFQGFSERDLAECDEPADILDGAIKAQKKLITGYKGDPRCPREMWKEANEPNQVAISLAGEPTLYEKLGGFIAECHDRGMTTFVVTNGTCPEALERLDPLPTQLYVTVAAPDEATFKKLCVPVVPKAWARLQKSIDLFPSLDTRRVVRHTLVKGWNLGREGEYAAIDRRAEPHFIEPKGYVFVGYSRERMAIANMPSQDEVMAFSGKLAETLGFQVAGEKRDSRVCVLASGSAPLKIGEA
ncbi:MAG: 4-demethylwyosine synthase TYW1 [Euryarchaeota archaeon]|nr:4-demethylwyosine synthase TYW1 [Euryarchaeota archaeon]